MPKDRKYKLKHTCDLGGVGGDAGTVLTVHSGYPQFLILKADFLSNKFLCGFRCCSFCLLFFSLSAFDTQGKVMA